jgi:hypothetical protein
MEKRVIGVYENEEQALAAVDELKRTGYSTDEISIVAKNNEQLDSDVEQVNPSNRNGLVAGATAGGAIGLAGLLVGMSTFVIPGFGPILAAGPIFATLGGAVAGLATNAGSLSDVLQKNGLNEEEARQYEDDVKNGKILVMTEVENGSPIE